MDNRHSSLNQIASSLLENADWINTPDTFQEAKVSDIFGTARRLGIKLDEKFDRLEKLQEVLAETLAERACLEEAGENTLLQDNLIAAIREEIGKVAAELD